MYSAYCIRLGILYKICSNIKPLVELIAKTLFEFFVGPGQNPKTEI